MTGSVSSPCGRALAAAKQGDWVGAQETLADIVQDVFGATVRSIQVSQDRYSLNSLNGFVQLASGEDYFFKFHHEEGEEVTLDELYRGEILAEAGYAVDLPVMVSREIGKQLLLYKRRNGPRFADVCDTLDFQIDARFDLALKAQERLDELTCSIYQETLHVSLAEQVGVEPINQLFHHRLVTPPDRQTLGGRAGRFFFERHFELPGVKLHADDLRAAKWVFNGIEYRDSIGELLERSLRLLEPRSLARFGAVVAHGDAHNANVWFEHREGEQANLVLFDPAFAGAHVPALLAEVKATFHNIFAHPRWLYSPASLQERFDIQVTYRSGQLIVDTNWSISELRRRFLEIKGTKLWRPLLRRLEARGLLPNDWLLTLRAALFCCPTLVMDLCAGGTGGHTPSSSALGLGVAVMLGSEPAVEGSGEISQFLHSIDPR